MQGLKFLGVAIIAVYCSDNEAFCENETPNSN